MTRLQIQRKLRARKRLQQEKEVEADSSSELGEEDEGYTGIVDAARKIYVSEGGLSGMYTGIAQDTGKTVADSFLFFLTYTFIRQQRQRSSKDKNQVLPVLDELTIGFLAGSLAKLFTTPIANIVTRKQTATLFSKGSKPPLSTSEIAAQIRAEKGLKGFWAGYPASLVLTLNPSITFFLYELFKNTLLPRSKREKPPAGATFLLAAMSKVIASSITYPFSLAKTQAQAASKEGSEDSKEANKTIFASIIDIARTEGPSGLYAGLSGDVLKGFFNHGITMLMKDLVYRFIVQAYYLFLVLLRRYPTPEELIERAKMQAEEFANVAKENAADAAEKVKEAGEGVVSGAVEGGKKAADSLGVNEGPSGLKSTLSSVGSTMNETAELVGDYVEDEAQEWRSLYRWFWEKVKDGGET